MRRLATLMRYSFESHDYIIQQFVRKVSLWMQLSVSLATSYFKREQKFTQILQKRCWNNAVFGGGGGEGRGDTDSRCRGKYDPEDAGQSPMKSSTNTSCAFLAFTHICTEVRQKKRKNTTRGNNHLSWQIISMVNFLHCKITKHPSHPRNHAATTLSHSHRWVMSKTFCVQPQPGDELSDSEAGARARAQLIVWSPPSTEW